jgi:hypothetical protein
MEIIASSAVILVFILLLKYVEAIRRTIAAEKKVKEWAPKQNHTINVVCRQCHGEATREKAKIVQWLRERRGPVECGACGGEMTADVLSHPFVKGAVAEVQLATHRNEEAIKTLHHLLGDPPPPNPALPEHPQTEVIDQPEIRPARLNSFTTVIDIGTGAAFYK